VRAEVQEAIKDVIADVRFAAPAKVPVETNLGYSSNTNNVKNGEKLVGTGGWKAQREGGH